MLVPVPARRRRMARASLVPVLAIALATGVQPAAAPATTGHAKAKSHRAKHHRAKHHRTTRHRAHRPHRTKVRTFGGGSWPTGLWRASGTGTTSLTFRASADANTSASAPTTNYGTRTSLRTDQSPTRTTFVRFVPTSVTGPVQSAVLQLYATASSRAGIAVHQVLSSAWDERAITWNTQPAVQPDVLGNSGAFAAKMRISIDVTGALNGSLPVTFAIVTPSSTSTSFASRETGAATGPALIVAQDATAVPPSADTTPPTTPSGLTAAGSDGQVSLAWKASADDVGVTAYEVLRDGVAIATVTGAPFADTGLANGIAHTYSVIAIDAAGNRSAPSVSVVGKAVAPAPAPAPDTTAPTAPSGVSAASGDGSAVLSWAASTDAVGVTGYRVYRGGTLVGSPASTAYTDKGLVNGTSYSYTVKAIDAAGNLSGASAAVSVTPAGAAFSGSCPNASINLCRPYGDSSPWNAPIPAGVAVDPKSATYVSAIADSGKPLTSDPDQYTVSVYTADAGTPLSNVYLYRQYYAYGSTDTASQAFHWTNFPAYYTVGGKVQYDMDGNHIPGGAGPTWPGVPVPAGTVPSTGTDGHTVILDTSTGMEYGFWRFDNLTSSSPVGPFNGYPIPANAAHNAWDGYRYQVNNPNHLGICKADSCGRASANPLLAGLVRKWEIDQGHIDHAIAFAYDQPAGNYRYPAAAGWTSGTVGTDLPLGGRLQLDPSLSDATIQGWGCTGACLVIAHALQQYGMYATDASGSSKIYLEDRATAHWDSSITRSLVSGIPWSAFRVVAPPAG